MYRILVNKQAKTDQHQVKPALVCFFFFFFSVKGFKPTENDLDKYETV